MILKSTQERLSVVFSGGYGDTGPDVTAVVTDADGATVLAAVAAKDPNIVGRYYFDLPPQPNVSELTVEWTDTFGNVNETLTFPVSVVGAQLFTIADLRAFGDGAIGKDPARFPDETLIEKRSEIAQDFQRICDISFVPRYGRSVLDGDWKQSLWVLHRRITKILAVSISGTSLSTDEIAALTPYPSGKIDRQGYYAWWPGDRPGNITISYEHGWPFPPPRVSQAAMRLARYELIGTDVSERMVSVQNELGTVRLSTQGATLLPSVDAVLARYDERSPVEVY